MFKRNHVGKPLALTTAGMLLLGLFSATGAQAAPGPEYGDIDTTATGSIIIHKHEFQTGSPVVGSPAQDTVLPKPLAGAQFSVTKIESINGQTVDLGTNAGWDALNGVTAAPECSVPGATLGTSQTSAATTSAGLATVSDLAVGAYLVCETVTPAGVVDKAQPFIVTIPFPHHTGSQATNDVDAKWLYNVHVYPKNSKGGLIKDIGDQNEYALGAEVTFPVTADVRTLGAGKYFTYFSVLDELDPRLTPSNPAVASVTVDGVAVDTDFYKVVTKGQKVFVVFGNEGLNWLTANAQGKKVEVVFSATVTGVGNGTIANVAKLYSDTDSTQPTPGDPSDPADPEDPTTPGDPSDPTDPNYPGDPSDPLPPTESNEVQTFWGSVTLKKVDAAGTEPNAGLQGARFEIYESTTPYAATCTASPVGDQVTVDGTPVTVTSDAAGTISIDGLFVKDTNEGASSTKRCYVLKEVAAPAGFVLPTGGNEFTALSVSVGANDLTSTPIENSKRSGPELPLTGAAGQVLLTLGGIAVVAIAGGLVLVRRKQNARA